MFPLSVPVRDIDLVSFLIESVQEKQLLFQYPDQIQSSMSQKMISGPPCLPEIITVVRAINQ
jgi:hypothetical protein